MPPLLSTFDHALAADAISSLPSENAQEHGSNTRDPKLYGPGFATAPPHSADDGTRYVLVTPDMLHMLNGGQAPLATLLKNDNTADRRALSTAEDSEFKDKAFLAAEHLEVAHAGSILEVTGDKIPMNPLSRYRDNLKEYLGEFLGTFVLLTFGNGVNCQVVLSKLTQGSYLSISFGWGIGVMCGVYTCGGISGAHLNPAVTISLAAFRGFPWRKVPGYALAQVLGAFAGSALIQANYWNLINEYEGGYAVRTFGEKTSTASLFFTAAQPYMSNISCFFAEVFPTAILLIVILAMGDANNNPVPAGMNGLILLFVIVGLGAALGTETAYCLNPARDLGPRIAAAVYGYPSTIWTYRHGYFFWTAILGPICGALFGCFTYDLLIFNGSVSPLNKPWRKIDRGITA